MFRRIRAKGTPALLVSMFAVVLACTGTAVAAQALITGKNVKDSSLTGKDIKDKSLGAKDFKGSVRGPQGPQGSQGAPGAQGPQGPAGPSVVGQITIVQSAQVPFGDEVVQSAAATCPAGQRVVSGGGASISDEQLAVTEPSDDRTSWFVIGIDKMVGTGEYVQATALCAPTGQAVASSVRSRAKLRAEVARAVAKVRAQYPGSRQ